MEKWEDEKKKKRKYRNKKQMENGQDEKEEEEEVSECHRWAYRAWPVGLGREQGVNCSIGGEQEDGEGHCPVTYQRVSAG